MIRPIVVTGGAGFIGCNLVDRLARTSPVLVVDSLARAGAEENLAWLQARHAGRLSVQVGDVRDPAVLDHIATQAAAVFHLAAQVAVTTSLADPIGDFETNVVATVGLLEKLRWRRDVPLIFASTNKVYGDLADLPLRCGERHEPIEDVLRARGVSENCPIQFRTPYGCSKGAADQYVLDYARGFGVPATVLRMSCIYGTRQRGTEDQGWVAHFLLRALAQQPITIYGDGRQVRDVLFVDDAVDAYVAALQRIEAVRGRAFNLGGGVRNAVSLREVTGWIEQLTGVRLAISYRDWRPGDQKWFVTDTRVVARELGLRSPVPWREGIKRMMDEMAPRILAAAG